MLGVGRRGKLLRIDVADVLLFGRGGEDVAAINGKGDERNDDDDHGAIECGFGLSVHGSSPVLFLRLRYRGRASIAARSQAEPGNENSYSFSAGMASTRIRFSYKSTS